MDIDQIQAKYLPIEDRFVLFVSTQSNEEYQLLFTRRIIKSLMPTLVKVIEEDSAIEKLIEKSPTQKEALMGYAQHEAMSNVNTKEQYQAREREKPLGDAPLLITRFKIKTLAKETRAIELIFTLEETNDFHLTLGAQMVQVFYKLMAEANKLAQWDLPIAIQDIDTSSSGTIN